MSKPKKSKGDDTIIVINKKASHDYFLENRLEAGLMLLGWEVKSLRQKKVQLIDSHIFIKNGEAFLFGANIVPLASTNCSDDWVLWSLQDPRDRIWSSISCS